MNTHEVAGGDASEVDTFNALREALGWEEAREFVNAVSPTRSPLLGCGMLRMVSEFTDEQSKCAVCRGEYGDECIVGEHIRFEGPSGPYCGKCKVDLR